MTDRVLIIDEDPTLREKLEIILVQAGFAVAVADNAASALARVGEIPIDIVLCDATMPGLDDFELIPQVARKLPGTPMIVMSADGVMDLAGKALEMGAYDFLAKPVITSEVLLTVKRAQDREQTRRASEHSKRESIRAIGERPIVAASNTMIEVLEMVERAAAYKTTALLTGEAGTGKEVLARAIHAQSPRRSQPFMTIHCGTTAEHALESELFGHAKGVMPGAVRAQRGVFEQACGGTLFIEEISLMPTALQAKLVSAIQEEEVRPVGDSKPVAIDVHVIAATSVDLEGAIADGSFREDLYYRLNVMQVQVPALRDRPEDIPLLCDHFLAHYSASLGKQVRRISNDALDRLIGYSWPGNVRELQNVIERAVIVTEDERVAISHLPREIVEASSTGASTDSKTFAMRRARRLFEIELITRALRETNGNRTHAAKLLEISHRALLYKIKDYGVRD